MRCVCWNYFHNYLIMIKIEFNKKYSFDLFNIQTIFNSIGKFYENERFKNYCEKFNKLCILVPIHNNPYDFQGLHFNGYFYNENTHIKSKTFHFNLDDKLEIKHITFVERLLL